MTRAEIREHIFKLIFRVEFNTEEEMKLQLEDYFQDEEVNIPEKDEAYIKDKYLRIYNMIDVLDSEINSNSKGWGTDRMGKVELAILRLAVYELKYDDTIPIAVAIDQAVELAKKYGKDESNSFVNGVLSSIAKTCENKGDLTDKD